MGLQTFLVDNTSKGKALVDFISVMLEVSKRQAKRIIDSRSVFVNNRRTWMASHPLKTGDTVQIQEAQFKREKKPLTRSAIIYEDDSILVLNKPAGMLANGVESAESGLQKLLGSRTIRAVHRLDRDTTGCLVFAKDATTWDEMVALFRARELKKIYAALVVGSFKDAERRIDTPLEGREAVSIARRVWATREVSLVEVEILTGRTHQIRKHLLGAGYPVLGDKEYTTKRGSSERFRAVPRQMLHAALIEFPHPRGGKRLSVRAPVPGDFLQVKREVEGGK